MSKTVTAVIFPVQDGEAPYIEEADKSNLLEFLQKQVGGFIEALNLNDGNLAIINEEGKINRLPLNVPASKYIQTSFQDVVAGTMVVVGNDKNGEMVSVDVNKVEQWLEHRLERKVESEA